MGCCATFTRRRIWDGYPLFVFLTEVAVTLAIWGACIGLIVKLPLSRAYAGIALALTLMYITRLWRILPGERRRVRRAVNDRLEDLLAEMPLKRSPAQAALPSQRSTVALTQSQRRPSPAYLLHEPFASVSTVSGKSSLALPYYYCMPPSPTASVSPLRALPAPPSPRPSLGQSSRRALPPPLVPLELDEPSPLSASASLRQSRSLRAGEVCFGSPSGVFAPSPLPPRLSCSTSSRRPSYAAREPFASTASMRAGRLPAAATGVPMPIAVSSGGVAGMNNSQCFRSYNYYPYR